MADLYGVGGDDLIWNLRTKRPIVLDGVPRHDRTAIILWSGLQMAYEVAHLKAMLRGVAPGGPAQIDWWDTVQISETTTLLDDIWAWAAFEIVTDPRDQPSERWLRLWCTEIRNPGRGRRILALGRGSVYIELEPTGEHPQLAPHQVFHVRWTSKRAHHQKRRKLAAGDVEGRFLQNEDRQRHDDHDEA